MEGRIREGSRSIAERHAVQILRSIDRKPHYGAPRHNKPYIPDVGVEDGIAEAKVLYSKSFPVDVGLSSVS
jgi:hypothetical protein